MGVRIQEVVIDCADPAALAAFWAQVLQARWGTVDEGWAVVDADPVLQDPEGNEFCFVMDESGEWTSTLRAALTNAP